MNTNEKALGGKFYFPNLIGLRFWMATTVIYRHIEEIKYMRNIQQDADSIKKFHTIGFYPMLMFFTLSGFLITYQLEVEKTKTKRTAIIIIHGGGWRNSRPRALRDPRTGCQPGGVQ